MGECAGGGWYGVGWVGRVVVMMVTIVNDDDGWLRGLTPLSPYTAHTVTCGSTSHRCSHIHYWGDFKHLGEL